MPKIKIIKSIAKRKFENQVDAGRRLLEQLGDGGPINSNERFLRVQEEQNVWSGNNISLLNKFFDDDSLVREYSAIVTGNVDEENSRLENIRLLRVTVEGRLDWLTDFVNRIEDFPQSEKTPTVSRHH